MTKVINLIGASGAGKTTIAKELEKKGYNIIHSYTTREPREKNEWGHRFIEIYGEEGENLDNGEFRVQSLMLDEHGHKRILVKEMIAYEELYGNIYFATDDQVERNKTNIYVVTPNGAEQVKKFYKDTDIEVISIYLAASEYEREKRLISRLQEITSEGLHGVNKRLTNDKQLFSILASDYVIDANRDIEELLADVTAAIKEE